MVFFFNKKVHMLILRYDDGFFYPRVLVKISDIF